MDDMLKIPEEIYLYYAVLGDLTWLTISIIGLLLPTSLENPLVYQYV